jgi:threonine dehydrogenase-like Zn-dependent dehydrogenase
MKAAVLQDGRFTIERLPDPSPGAGQLLVRPLACGVCGSDLHIKDHAPHLCDLLHRAGFRGFMDPARPVVLGHEFACELIEAGAGEQRFARGQRLVALPFLAGADGVELLGYSNGHNGAFAEAMLIDAAMAFAVPDHVPTEVAALAEPLSVAVHAVNEAQASAEAAFCVVGCGPVGLFVIARLRALGLGPVIAVEPNPARRALAEALGAQAFAAGDGGAGTDAWWADQGLPIGLSDAMAVDPAARRRQRAVIFECVGKPGMTMQVARAAPVGATIVCVGTCMEPDPIEPAFLLQKGLRLQYVFAYQPHEFAAAVEMIADDPQRLAPLVTRQVGLAQVDEAFAALSAGGSDIKVLVRPNL